MKKTKIILIILSIVLACFLIYQYPIQRVLALKNFKSYISQQGIESEIIKSKEVFKNWKDGGYKIIVTLDDDPNYIYIYRYQPWTHKKNEHIKFNRITLQITDIEKSMVLDPPYDGKCKYPPIDE